MGLSYMRMHSEGVDRMLLVMLRHLDSFPYTVVAAPGPDRSNVLEAYETRCPMHLHSKHPSRSVRYLEVVMVCVVNLLMI